MGLDMYLIKKRYLGRARIKVIGNEYSWYESKENENEYSKVMEVSMEQIYWRKANAIHKWFVDNCQNGVDDCCEHYVEFKKLRELRDLCKRVIDDNDLAKELLPTCPGFFFGSVDYDEYYFNDIKFTYDELNKILEEGDYCDFYYRSSW